MAHNSDHVIGLLPQTLTEVVHEERSMTRMDAPRAYFALYGTKPLLVNMRFRINEFLAGPNEFLRESAQSRETVLFVGPLQLDLLTRAVRRGERMIQLLPREFRLLEYMMRHKGQLLTRASLFKEVWHYKFVPQSNLVDVHIGRLRRKIDGQDELPMILTIRRQGFVLRTFE